MPSRRRFKPPRRDRNRTVLYEAQNPGVSASIAIAVSESRIGGHPKNSRPNTAAIMDDSRRPRWRMQLAAKRLNESDAKVASIAQEVGYDSEAAFSRAFKKFSGRSPSEWRA
jgi:methylphosphotriester-DNA--protein-cysteine methyltransferase